MNAKSAKSATENTTEQSPIPNERHFVFADSFEESVINKASDVYVEIRHPYPKHPIFGGMVELTFITRRGRRVQYTLSSYAAMKVTSALKTTEVA